MYQGMVYQALYQLLEIQYLIQYGPYPQGAYSLEGWVHANTATSSTRQSVWNQGWWSVEKVNGLSAWESGKNKLEFLCGEKKFQAEGRT